MRPTMGTRPGQPGWGSQCWACQCWTCQCWTCQCWTCQCLTCQYWTRPLWLSTKAKRERGSSKTMPLPAVIIHICLVWWPLHCHFMKVKIFKNVNQGHIGTCQGIVVLKFRKSLDGIRDLWSGSGWCLDFAQERCSNGIDIVVTREFSVNVAISWPWIIHMQHLTKLNNVNAM